MKRVKIALPAFACFTVLLIFCIMQKRKQRPPEDFEVAAAWADMSIYITKNTPANSPPCVTLLWLYRLNDV